MGTWSQQEPPRTVPSCASGDKETVTLRIFHVEGGGCVHAEAAASGSVLVDCGVDSGAGFRPSNWLRSTGRAEHVRGLVLSSFNDAYVADLAGVSAMIEEASFYVAPHAFDLAGKLLPGHDLQAIDRSTAAVGPLELRLFHTEGTDTGDPRDLSVVTLMRTPALGIVLGSEMQRSGWQELLGQREFREALRTVDVFVASDNGSRSGFCPELFDICEPRVVVLTSHTSEPSAGTYADHAAGLTFANGSLHRTLSTGRHGVITFVDNVDGPPTCTTQR